MSVRLGGLLLAWYLFLHPTKRGAWRIEKNKQVCHRNAVIVIRHDEKPETKTREREQNSKKPGK
jgi:hypothetical protein